MTSDLQKELIELVSECVRNKCVNPPGGEMKSIRTVGRYLDSYDVKYEVFESGPDRGNLLAQIKGTSSGPSLMLGPAHVDVVPVADPSVWRYPPFSGEIHDGCIWGRGTLDMLFIVAAQATVFAHLVKDGFRPKGNLKFLVVSDEEVGGEHGTGWMVKNHPDAVKVDYLMTEAGGYEVAPNRYVYSYGEKGGTWLRISFKGTEQHGSMPYGSDNAVSTMAEVIRRLCSYNAPVTTEHIAVLLRGMPVSPIKRWLITRRVLLNRLIGMLSKGDMAQAKLLHSISRMTISPNQCQGGTKVNVVPGQAWLDIDIRTLPGQDEAYIMHHLKHALGPFSDKVDLVALPKEAGSPASYGNASKMQSPLVDAMESVTREIYGPGAILVPMLMPGVTDCRFFREEWDTQAYGFSMFDRTLKMSELVNLAHGTDERVPLETLSLTAETYMGVVRRLLG